MNYMILAELVLAIFLIIAPIGMLSALIVTGIIEEVDKYYDRHIKKSNKRTARNNRQS